MERSNLPTSERSEKEEVPADRFKKLAKRLVNVQADELKEQEKIWRLKQHTSKN